MKKKKLAIFSFVLALILFAIGFNFNLTGNVIGSSFLTYSSFLHLLGLGFLIGSVLLLTSKKSLDYLIVPTGQGNENILRTEKALKEWDKGYIQKIAISGKREGSLKDSERAQIYNALIKKDIKPKNIFISGGKDSKENIEYFFKKLGKLGKEVHDIGIVSYPSHLDRFEIYFEQAKQKGLIPKDTKLHRIETNETSKEETYGILAKLKDKYPALKYLNEKTFVGPLIKNIIGG